MDYLINPMMFYWADVFFALKLTLMIGGVVGIPFGIMCYLDNEEPIAKMCITTGIIVIIMSAFIPSSETFIKMQVAKLTTKDNVETVLQTIDEKTDKLIEAFSNKE